MFKEAGFSATTEVTIGEKSRPADVAVTGFDARPLAIDLTISHPLKPSEPRDPETVKRHLLSREERKTSKYIAATARAGWVFTPAAFHPWGGLGPSCSTLLEKVVRRFASPLSGRERGHFVDSFWQRLSSALMRGVAQQLSIAGQVILPDSTERDWHLVGGPASPLRVNPLVDDAGNLLPEALPDAPPEAEWGRDAGPLQQGEMWLGPMRVRVRLSSQQSP